MYEKNVKNRRICIKSLEKEKKKRKQKKTLKWYIVLLVDLCLVFIKISNPHL